MTRFGRFGITNALTVALATAFLSPHAAAFQCGDLDHNGAIATSDALRLLRVAVGQNVAIDCPGGLSCWDTNSNGLCDAAEDTNGNQACDVGDCVGPQGPQGPAGNDGPPGPAGKGAGLVVRDSNNEFVGTLFDDEGLVRKVGPSYIYLGATKSGVTQYGSASFLYSTQDCSGPRYDWDPGTAWYTHTQTYEGNLFYSSDTAVPISVILARGVMGVDPENCASNYGGVMHTDDEGLVCCFGFTYDGQTTNVYLVEHVTIASLGTPPFHLAEE